VLRPSCHRGSLLVHGADIAALDCVDVRLIANVAPHCVGASARLGRRVGPSGEHESGVRHDLRHFGVRVDSVHQLLDLRRARCDVSERADESGAPRFELGAIVAAEQHGAVAFRFKPKRPLGRCCCGARARGGTAWR
jgi:hypothetical protein